ncbi:MAG: aminopeptidase P family protein [Candidatus Magasanikbacteria bacterium]|jgi:Xaa-Pro aminopeptidase|nr:aminopeptidase P family protein [Candidatus Magasanikbacteria bacterium]
MTSLLYSSTKDADMYYLTKVQVADPFFALITDSQTFIFLDHREYGVFVEKNTNPNIELILVNSLLDRARELAGDSTVVQQLALLIIKEYGEGNTIAVPPSFPLLLAKFLERQRIIINVQQPFFPNRLTKSMQEVQAITSALKKTQIAFTYIENRLAEAEIKGDFIVGDTGEVLTSELLSQEVEHVLLEQGMKNEEGMIISCAQHAAIPHHSGSGALRPNQTIICDIFPRDTQTGYFADMTRTYIKGDVSTVLQEMYDAVQLAQERAIKLIAPGVPFADVHAACVQTFIQLGHKTKDEGFIHGTGHGLGVEIHEAPYVSAGSKATAEIGNVVTVEPGLYYSELGGVRIEDVVVITKDGCKNLTNYPKVLQIP